MVAPSQRKIENIHSVLDCGVNRVEDVLAARTVTALINVVGEDVVVPQPGTRCNPGNVIDADTIDDSSLASDARGDPGGVSPVPLDCRRIEPLLLRLVEENFCHNHFWRDVPAVLVGVVGIAILRIALGEPRGIAEPGWIEERVRLLDASVDVADLNAGTSGGPAAGLCPGAGGVDDVVALTQVRLVKPVVVGALHHWCGCDRGQRSSIQLHRHCVE